MGGWVGVDPSVCFVEILVVTSGLSFWATVQPVSGDAYRVAVNTYKQNKKISKHE